jgi:hypothetical protein
MLAGTFFAIPEPPRSRRTGLEARVRLTILFLAITTSLLVAIPAVHPAGVAAHALAEPAEPAASEQPPERSLVGTLDQVDDQAAEFVVKTASGKQKFVLQDGATIRQGSKTIKASELASHKGEKVKVRYREAAGVRRAEWIVVASPSAHKVNQQN